MVLMDQELFVRKWRRYFSFLLLLFLALVLLSFPAGGIPLVASPSINHENYTISDRIALLSFKSLIISNDPHGGLETWKSSPGDFCATWRGVTCGHRHRRVVSLDLSSLNLTGTISPSIANLTFLRRLDLSNNSLRGSIPGELGSLPRLQHLNLSFNSLEGSIPASLSHCSQLRNISLRNNELSGDIPPSLSNLSTLSVLSLSKNALSGVIPSTIWHLSSLTILVISTNHLTGKISPSLGNLSASLTTLDLSENSLIGDIPPSFANLHALIVLGLAFNNLIGAVPQSLWNLSKLVIFDLQSNKLLTGSLPSDLGHTLPNLSFFSLSYNQFYGCIPMSLSNASSLQTIQLGHNLFTGTIPPSLGYLPSLTRLFLDGNQLEANMMGTGWDFLANLSNCTNLQILELGSNKLGGELPQSVANLSRTLEWLTIESNNISGSIPPGIGNLVSLSLLYLDHNLLTGTIPSTIGKLGKLHKLFLHNNRLLGEIPFAIGNLTQLNQLNLSNNYLTEHIPASLGDCGQLRLLYLGNNNLTGTIPNRVVNISSLINLVLGDNSLSGLLPAEVGSLITLVELDLSNNRLTGEIPSTIGTCQELQYLYLQGNHFNGTIPSSFSAGLEVLDLSSNNLSGHIPESLASIRSLVMLNLSFNDLDGEVPKGGAFLNSTKVSLLGNKDLCGGNSEFDLPPCSNQRKHRYSRLTIILSAVGASLCLLALVFCFIFARWQRKSKNKHDPSAIQHPMKNKYMRVSYNELLKATDGFSSANLIGQGSFGSVYKGTMRYHDNQNVNVAVKVLNLQQRGASKSFMAECEALRNIRHRNLLKILTSCSSIDPQGNDFKALVFEYLPNGSLEKWLHCKENDERAREKLSLIQRLNIAIDVASALDYLHNKGPVNIVHCDLKPSNILLDNDMSAHVGDFGLARFLIAYATRSSQRSSSSIILKGSIGYVAPEYGICNEVSAQGDLYSYGVVILEMFTGRRPTDDSFKEGLNLHRFVEMTFPEQLMRIIDPHLLIGGDADILPQGTASRALDLLNFTPLNGKPIRIMFSHRDPSIRKSGYANIFIKNLDSAIDNKSLSETFATFGTVLSCKVATDSNGQSKGYGYVQFEHEDAAQRAITQLNGMLMNGKQVYVGLFVRRQERDRANGSSKFTNVYVKNLSETVTDDNLMEKFSSFGNITKAVIMRDANGNSRGFGFVNFERPDDAATAVQKLNGETFKDKVLYVGKAQKKSEREAELKAKFEQERAGRIEKLKASNLYLKNLDDSINDEKLKELFSSFGKILSCKVMLDSQGQSRGYGFVQFSSPEEANRAVNDMNGKMIERKPLFVAVAQRKEERRARLQAHFAQLGAPGTLATAITPMAGYHPGPPRLPPQQIYFGQGAPGLVPPQPAGYGFQQQLLPGIRPGVAPNFVLPYHLQRQGQPGQRLGVRRGISQQMPQPQLIQRGSSQGFRYMQNARNGVDPTLMPQGLMGPVMPLPFDASSVQVASMDAVRSPTIPITALASALASASPENQRLMLGEQLFPLVERIERDHAGKVTGMLLEMDQTEVLHLLESPDALQKKVGEAMGVLRAAQAPGQDAADQLGSLSLND